MASAKPAPGGIPGLRWWIAGLIFLATLINFINRLTLSIIVWSIASMLHAFATGLFSLNCFRFLLGIGEAGNWPGAARVIAEWFPARQRAIGMGIFNSGVCIGSIIAPPLIVWLQLTFGWRTTFLFTGSLGFIWLALWLMFYESPERHRAITPEEYALIKEGQPA